MLLVAFSLLMCCSLVCRANLYARFPELSIEAPTILPGRDLLSSSFTAIKAAWGPPHPRGTPNLCEEPITMSAFNSPGAFNKVSANKSLAKVIRASFF